MHIAIVQCHKMSNLHVESRELHFAKILKDFGCEVTIHVLSGAVSNEPRITNINREIECFYYRVDNPNATSAEHTSEALKEEIFQVEPQVVLFKGLGYKIIDEILPILNSKTKSGVIIGGKVIHANLKKFDFVFAEHLNQINQIKSVFPEIKANFFVMPKLVDWNAVEKNKNTPRVYDICNVGQFIARKNQAALAPLFGKAKIAFVGAGEEIDNVKTLACDYKDILFAGNVEKDEVYRLVSQSKLMVHTSLHEGLPRASIEAFACGTPLVAYQKTLGKIFENLDFVLLVEEHELESEVLKLLGNSSQIAKMSESAQKYARQIFSSDALEKVASEFFTSAFETN